MDLNIIGASGHGKVVADLVEALGYKVIGFYDDNKDLIGSLVHNAPIVSTSDVLLRNACATQCHIAIGINSVRKKMVLLNNINEFPVLTHPSAILSPQVSVGIGSVIMAGGILQVNVIIGKHCIINTRASIDHDCKLSDYVQIAPGAILCGSVTVGECSYIGAGAVIKQGVCIGKNCMIGAGSLVLKDVPDNSMVYGAPAKLIKQGKFI